MKRVNMTWIWVYTKFSIKDFLMEHFIFVQGSKTPKVLKLSHKVNLLQYEIHLAGLQCIKYTRKRVFTNHMFSYKDRIVDCFLTWGNTAQIQC